MEDDLKHTIETDEREIEITIDMIAAGDREMLKYSDPEMGDAYARRAVVDIFTAMWRVRPKSIAAG